MNNRLIYALEQIDNGIDNHYYDGINFIGIVEQVSKLDQIIPASYKGYGDYEYAGFDDKNGLNIYHRLISVTTDRDEEVGYGKNPLKIETYNLRLVAFGNQRDIDDSNVDINYKIADEIETLIPKRFVGVQLSNIDARNVLIDVTSRNHNKRTVFTEELPDTEIKIKPESLLFSIDYNIRIEYIEDCKDLTCDPTPPLVDINNITCANFSDATYGLTQAKFDECGLDSFCTPPNSLSAAFSADDETPNAGVTVTFTDESTGSPDSWFWDFGDGNYSTSQNPTHTYLVAGSYTVRLRVQKSGSIGDTTTLAITVDYDAVAQAFISNASITGDTQKDAINELILNLKGVGSSPNGNNLHTKFTSGHDIFPYCPVDGSTANATAFAQGLLDNFTLTFVNFLSGDFTPSGLQGNATTKYGRTGIIPSTHLSQNDSGITAYCNTNTAETKVDMGANDGTRIISMVPRNAFNNQGIGFMNDGTQMTMAPFSAELANALGLIDLQRTGASAKDYRKNGSIICSSTTASTGLPTVEIYIHGRNDTGTPAFLSSKKYSGFAVRPSFNSSEMEDWEYCWNTYQLALGRNSKP